MQWNHHQGAKGAISREAETALDAPPPPRTNAVEIVRSVRSMYRDPLSGWLRLVDRFGPVVLQPTPIMHTVHLFGPEANRLVMLDRERIFSAGRSWGLIIGRVFRNGLLLRDGTDHPPNWQRMSNGI